MGQCKFCNHDKPLVDAHLVPRCLYTLDGKLPLKIVGLFGETRPKRSNIGLYDPNILCAECDGRIGLWDQHACETLSKDSRKMAIAVVDDGKAVDPNGKILAYKIENADAEKISKFALSVLWRCHHSTREEASTVNLGPHADRMHDILVSDVTISDHGYDVCLEYHEDFSLVMWQGRWRTEEGVTINTFMASNFSFHVRTGVDQPGNPLRSLSIRTGAPVVALAIEKRKTNFGQQVIQGLKLNRRKYGDPWKR
jgi:hypothetical protein